MAAYHKGGQQKDSFINVVKKYIPAKLDYALKDLLLKEALRADKDISKATSLLLQYLDDNKSPVSIASIAGWFEEFSVIIDKENSQRLINKLSNFVLQESDKGKEHYLYLIQMRCYNTMGDNARAKMYAFKAYNAAELPAEYKDMLRETWDFTASQ